MNNLGNGIKVIELQVLNEDEFVNLDVEEEKELEFNVEGYQERTTSDYTQLKNKPQINGVELIGNKKGKDLKVLDNEDYITNEEILEILKM